MLVLPFDGNSVTHGGLAFSPDGRSLAAANRQRAVVFRDPADPADVFALPPGTWGQVVPLAGGWVAVGRDQAISVHHPTGGGEPFAIPDGESFRVMAADPGGRILWASGRVPGPRDVPSPVVRRYDLATRAFIEPPLKAAGAVWNLAAAGGLLAGGAKKVVRVWRVTGDVPPKRAAMVAKVPGGWVNGVAASADGRAVAASARKVAVVWDVATGEEAYRVNHRQTVKGVAFHPRRPILATVSTDRTVTFSDPIAGKEVARFEWQVGPLYAVAFAPDGLRCAAAGEQGIVVWDVE